MRAKGARVYNMRCSSWVALVCYDMQAAGKTVEAGGGVAGGGDAGGGGGVDNAYSGVLLQPLSNHAPVQLLPPALFLSTDDKLAEFLRTMISSVRHALLFAPLLLVRGYFVTRAC